MIGIYKITNLLNNKIYIGQSTNIQRRFSEHKTKGATSRIPLCLAIQKEGYENFRFEIIEELPVEKLNERESYWIKYYNSVEEGYNCSIGGDYQSAGENNGMSILTEKDIIQIRLSYQKHERCKEVYQIYADKISFSSFSAAWSGKTWSHIMPEVFTEENKKYYAKEATNGERSFTAILTNEEVVKIRQRYVIETAKNIYQDYKDRLSFQTFQSILWGRSYKTLPLYKKKSKEWINL